MNIKNLLGHKPLVVLVLFYTSLITWLSLAKIFIPIDIRVEGSDKIGHLLAYFVFAIVWFLFFFYSEKLSKSYLQSVVWASLIGVVYGVLMEIFQGLLTDYRSPDWKDILANISGIVFAIICIKVFKNKLVKLRNKGVSS